MNLRRFMWTAIIVFGAFMVTVEVGHRLVVEPWLGEVAADTAEAITLALGILAFFAVAYLLLHQMRERAMQQNRELAALNAVGRSVMSGSMDLQEVLGRALDHVMQVTGADAAAVTLAEEFVKEGPRRFCRGRWVHLLDEIEGQIPDSGGKAAGTALVRIVDLGDEPLLSATETFKKGFRAFASVGLVAQGRKAGTMSLLARRAGCFSGPDGGRLLEGIASQLALAARAGSLFQDVRRREREAQALHRLGLEISSLQELQQVFRLVVEQARELLAGQVSALCLGRGSDGDLVLADWSGAAEGFEPAALQECAPAGAGLSTDLRPVRKGPRCRALAPAYRASLLMAPLTVGSVCVGEVCVARRPSGPFSDEERELLSGLADLAAIALNNARLRERERRLAVLEERDRLAGDMHDSLAQVIGYLHLRAAAARRHLLDGRGPRASEALEEMVSLAQKAYLDVREVILGLRESVATRAGLEGTLSEYLRKVGRQAGVATQLEIEEEHLPTFPPEVEVQVVRVIQEALANVRKHARAKRCWIRFGQCDGSLRITVEDDGAGIRTGAPGPGQPPASGAAHHAPAGGAPGRPAGDRLRAWPRHQAAGRPATEGLVAAWRRSRSSSWTTSTSSARVSGPSSPPNRTWRWWARPRMAWRHWRESSVSSLTSS